MDRRRPLRYHRYTRELEFPGLHMTETPASSGRPWPQVGKVTGGIGLGTGFMVGGGRVLTCAHILGTKQLYSFETLENTYELQVERLMPELDLALLRFVGEAPIYIKPVKLAGPVERFPIGFLTWGYRELVRGRPELLIGEGTITAQRVQQQPPGGFQLESRDVRPGMSGAPIAVAAEPEPLVVGVVLGRHFPKDLRDDESLALGQRVMLIPPELITELGGLQSLSIEEDELTQFLGERLAGHARTLKLLRIGFVVGALLTSLTVLWALLVPGGFLQIALAVVLMPFMGVLLFAAYEREIHQQRTTENLLALSRNRGLGAQVAPAMAKLALSAGIKHAAQLQQLAQRQPQQGNNS